MATAKGRHSNRQILYTLKTMAALAVCLYSSAVSGQMLRSLTRPQLLQTNGIGGFQNSDPSNFFLDLGGSNPTGLGLGSQGLVNPALITAPGGGRYPAIGSLGGAGTLTGYNSPNTQYPEIYTAIGKDNFDEDSQMRLTITERFSNSRFSTFDAPTDWYVQGTFLNSQLRNKAGNYYVVLTAGGRTADGCESNTLGRVVGRVLYGSNSAPSGILQNHLMMGASGPTVYASTLEGISRRQLVGGAIAACESISDSGLCSGYIPFCATISKDLFQAMEVPVEQQIELSNPTPNVVPFGVTGLNTGSLPTGGGVLGSNLGNNGGNVGLAINSPTAFSTSEQATIQEDEKPTALGLFA